MIRVIFKELKWNVQDYEWSEEEHVVSIVNFDVEENGLMNTGCSARILQPLGVPCETATLEISHPTHYDGELDFESFREAATDYYREACKEGMQKIWKRAVEFELHPVFRKG